jgi:hypothetical protein
MKQREDNKTIDMFNDKPKATSYTFHVILEDGTTVEWKGLTITRAKRMCAATETNTPSNVAAFGYREFK